MADPKDASSLLQRAGFTLLTVDIEDFVYPSMFELMEDLRDMGEGNAVLGRYVDLCSDGWGRVVGVSRDVGLRKGN
jgi:NADH dehydrogenase [ubiquinone] 1 alpha subcomplex assembly factor 5